MLLSLFAGQVPTCSGYDCVSHSAIPNHHVGFSWNEYDLPGAFGFVGDGSLGSVRL